MVSRIHHDKLWCESPDGRGGGPSASQRALGSTVSLSESPPSASWLVCSSAAHGSPPPLHLTEPTIMTLGAICSPQAHPRARMLFAAVRFVRAEAGSKSTAPRHKRVFTAQHEVLVEDEDLLAARSPRQMSSAQAHFRE
jgi:hypothetical protein